jgi:hypothetical protein
MNKILKPYLQNFFLFFFDDILICSRTWDSHIQHVDKLLQLLQDHQLFVKKSKYFFGASELEYLGHIVGHGGVCVDPNKIQDMQDWPRPKTLKILQGFLSLTRHYMIFFHHYGKISRPLTNLLKMNAFQQTPAAERYFLDLKKVMCTTLILSVPNFNKNFWSNQMLQALVLM